MPSRRHPLLCGKFALGLFLASSISGQSPSAPPWLVGYPGVNARTQATPGLLESTYEAEAKPGDVIAHYQKLFETAGLPFHANFDGVGTTVRGTAPEGDLLILIRPQGKGTAVRVDVAVKSPELKAAPAAAPPPTPLPTQAPPPPRAERTGREHVQNMEKYDQPMRPPRRPPPPALAWPPWLVHIDGANLEIQKGVDQVGLKILKCSYATYADRNAIQSFYAALLNANGYRVRSQSSASWPTTSKAWIEASDHEIGEGPRIEIRIELVPVGQTIQVDLRLTARP